LLKQDPSISVVSCRRLAQNEVVKQVRNLPVNTIGGVAHRKADPSRDYGWDRQGFSLWQGYTFNPGLRRMSDYRMLGSFKRWGDETDASLFFKRKRMVVAYLTAPACETTGAERRLLKQKTFATRGRAFNCCGPIGVFGSAELLCLIEPQTGKAMAPERMANSATMSSAAKSATAELLVPAVVDYPPK
jgi:hypothetical protein